MSEDPVFIQASFDLTDPQGFNSYSYARNNPLRYVDPTGQIWEEAESYFNGVGNALMSNNALGLGRENVNNKYYQAGQDFGDVLSILQGSVESAAGLAVAATGLGGGLVLAPATGGASIAGGGALVAGGTAAAAHGSAVASVAARNLVGGGNTVPSNTSQSRSTVPNDINKTIQRITSGEKFPHKNDGGVFKNKEQLLPVQNDPSYYREYVHPTPGINGAGEQRVVTGKNGETYFSPDHYKTFIGIKE